MNHLAILTIVATVIGVLVKILKSDVVQARLPIPKNYFPWIALGLGAVGALVQLWINPNADAAEYIQTTFESLVAGLVPVGVHELGTNRNG